MFFVLKNKHCNFMHRDTEDNKLIATDELQHAKVFKLRLAVVSVDTGERLETTGNLTCKPPTDPAIPSGVPGEWEIVLIDLRLA